ncbi:MAG: IS110 family transposase [Bacteroidetes bacterium]|nr:IS110 family transposase [Bacteroidota bacterium]
MAKRRENLNVIKKHAAGIDIGSRRIFIGIANKQVVSFDTFTISFQKAVEYLKENKITSVAMESTGVYWTTLYDMLNDAGFEVYLVKSNSIKNVPGRKTDVLDCQWIQQLHSYGLLRSSFIPPSDIRVLRSYTTLRRKNIQLASDHIRRAQKALDLMNIKLHFAISEIHGASGMRILKAILTGEHDPHKLVELCDKQILKTKRETVINSLIGNYREEHLFALKQAIDGYEYYQTKILECDKEIEKLLESLTKDMPVPKNIKKPKPIRRNKPNIKNLHPMLMKLTAGNDPSQITGLTDSTLLEIISRVGVDMSFWNTSKHFTSWLGLAPNMHDSGNKKKNKKVKNKSSAGQIFRIAAHSLTNSKHNAFGAFYKRIRAKKGKLFAMKATARKLAVTYYNIMTKGIDYVEEGITLYQQKVKEQRVKYLQKQARYFGYSISQIEAS